MQYQSQIKMKYQHRSHQSLYSGGVHVKQSFPICITFKAVYEDSVSDHVTYVTITCVTKFNPEFQKYKERKCNSFYQRKRVNGQYFWQTSFWLHKLVI